ncbi:RNA polymerase sigma factor [Pedobacter paludis]|uniref:RNA polymerase subunit sigma n=1 Tax=Pedobacter paludis TaxID=2203212 RepID=A0A317F0M4_9SPHI|nr:RNA polymerase sigma factor [Pedobacter paludis]PWS32684.1 RNA polymerase subunit sigma [Pedobacter paludis]
MNNSQFNQMIEQHRSMLNAFALKFTGDIEDANDLIQDTMVKALRFSESFESGTNIKGWLYTILRNTFINEFRRNAKRQSVVTQQEEISSAHLLQTATRNGAEGSFAMRDINLALKNLPDAYSVPFIRYFEGYRYHEIAEELDIPLGTVKTRIHEARKLLQKQLQMYKAKKFN